MSKCEAALYHEHKPTGEYFTLYEYYYYSEVLGIASGSVVAVAHVIVERHLHGHKMTGHCKGGDSWPSSRFQAATESSFGSVSIHRGAV